GRPARGGGRLNRDGGGTLGWADQHRFNRLVGPGFGDGRLKPRGFGFAGVGGDDAGDVRPVLLRVRGDQAVVDVGGGPLAVGGFLGPAEVPQRSGHRQVAVCLLSAEPWLLAVRG